MPFVDAHPPGTLCWVELATLDTAAAKRFYQDLFGWTFREFPMEGDELYTICQHRERDAAALYKMRPEQHAQGVPPNWLTYVAVASADDTTTQARALGATALTNAFDVMGMGRMAVLQDPTQAVFAIWQARTHRSIGVENEPGALCWSEVMTGDTTKAKSFYTRLFGWTSESMPMPTTEYTVFKLGDQSVAGMLPIPAGHDFIPPHWVPYFAVHDCDATVAKAKAAGSTVHVPPTDIPNVGRFSTLADPQGAAFAVLKPAQS